MESVNEPSPWVSFCMSTYKRPALLRDQLSTILQQTFTNFEVVVSDNDPESTAREVVRSFQDKRLKYFSNIDNLGMVASFNKSIDRAVGEYIVMITDDDPVIPEMLEQFRLLVDKHPGFGIYCGCERLGIERGKIEIFEKKDFVFQLLHPRYTGNLLWSSCLIRKNVLTAIGGMPNYGSPHLADHAMLALCGGVNGGVMINKMFSQLTAHDNNFSKGNIQLYFLACEQFYNLITKSFGSDYYIHGSSNALLKHLERWFITYSFSLRKYYTHTSPDLEKIASIEKDAVSILSLPFMQHCKSKYYIKFGIFKIKTVLIKLKLLS